MLEEYLKPKLFAALEPATRAGLGLEFVLARRKPAAALHGGYTLADVAEALEPGRDRPLELHFAVYFLEEYLYKDVAPRLVHPGFFGHRVFQRMLRRPGREPGGRPPAAQYLHSRPDPLSAFSLFNSKPPESQPFGRSYLESLLPRAESRAAEELSLPFAVEPQNFHNIGRLLEEEERVQRLEPTRIRSVKPREEPARRGEASPGEPPRSEDSLRFRLFDAPARGRPAKYDEDVRRLLHKI